jgi:hypothetical protein
LIPAEPKTNGLKRISHQNPILGEGSRSAAGAAGGFSLDNSMTIGYDVGTRMGLVARRCSPPSHEVKRYSMMLFPSFSSRQFIHDIMSIMYSNFPLPKVGNILKIENQKGYFFCAKAEILLKNNPLTESMENGIMLGQSVML